ncbi:hypothetical protein V5O48_007482 [Marasmius crinis-equi]|uniref:Uncharacterized protein n=1 Tax=Marasmius crinis-equi TaxID=585013 RepID=A0ABR3FGM6_9AGAR
MSQNLGRVVSAHESRHFELIKALTEVEHAPKDLATVETKIVELQTQLEETRLNPGKVKRKSADGLDKHSHAPKLAFLRRSYSGKGKDVEDRYLPIREKQNQLEQALSQAKFEQMGLKGKTNEYQALRQKLDALYGIVFDGPTPGYPNEDQLEQQVSAAKAVCERVRVTLAAERAAYEYVTKAEKTMRECRARLRDALEVAATSMFASWRSVQDQESHCLQAAHKLACQVPEMVRDARDHCPEIRPLEQLSIIEGVPSRSEASSPDQFYGFIKTAASEVTRTHEYLCSERSSLASRVTANRTVIENAEKNLKQYKDELCSLRRGIFEEIAEKAKGDPPFGDLGDLDDEYPIDEAPPSYEYEPPSSYLPLLTVTPTPLAIPSKTISMRPQSLSPLRRLPVTASPEDFSPVSPMSGNTNRWSSNESTTSTGTSRSSLSVTNSSESGQSGHTVGRRVRPLPRPPGS